MIDRCTLRRMAKNLLHAAILASITVSLLTEGAKAADWLFLALSLTVEIGA